MLDGPEGVMELKPLSPVVARALIDAGRPGDDDGPGTPPYLAQGDSDASGIPEHTRESRPGIHTSACEGMHRLTGEGVPRENHPHMAGRRVRRRRPHAQYRLRRGTGDRFRRGRGYRRDRPRCHCAGEALQSADRCRPHPRTAGVADAHHHLLFYASGGYTASALKFADERGSRCSPSWSSAT